MGKVTKIYANDKAALDSAIAEHSTKTSTAVLLVKFCGALDAAGHSWCGDCVEAEPVIKAAVDEAESDIVMVEVPLVRAEYKGNAEHWARQYPGVKISKIPTLVRYGKGGRPVGSLIEDQCKDRALVDELVSSD